MRHLDANERLRFPKPYNQALPAKPLGTQMYFYSSRSSPSKLRVIGRHQMLADFEPSFKSASCASEKLVNPFQMKAVLAGHTQSHGGWIFCDYDSAIG